MSFAVECIKHSEHHGFPSRNECYMSILVWYNIHVDLCLIYENYINMHFLRFMWPKVHHSQINFDRRFIRSKCLKLQIPPAHNLTYTTPIPTLPLSSPPSQCEWNVFAYMSNIILSLNRSLSKAWWNLSLLKPAISKGRFSYHWIFTE